MLAGGEEGRKRKKKEGRGEKRREEGREEGKEGGEEGKKVRKRKGYLVEVTRTMKGPGALSHPLFSSFSFARYFLPTTVPPRASTLPAIYSLVYSGKILSLLDSFLLLVPTLSGETLPP